MTALSEYDRLECQGLWRAAGGAQRREVIVAFGDASLVICDQNAVALTHWSLPAVSRLNPGTRPALYAPGPEDDETLELEDTAMIQAIERVRGAIARRRPRPGRLRLTVLGLFAAAIAALAVFWLPDALVRHTAGVVPPATRAQIGRQVLDEVTALTGKPCRTRLGLAALKRLETRLGLGGARLVVLREGVPGSAHLPGGVILLDAALVEDHEGPEVAAAHAVQEAMRYGAGDPLARLLHEAGALATLKLLTTGNLPREALAAHAGRVLTAPAKAIGTTAFLDRLAAAGVPSTPFAYALDATGETTLEMIEADPFRGKTPPRLLSDNDWIGLQGICEP
ncbi:hypothetical protein DDZ14_11385 [Maritimibacter sp. 55A14]|uniref:hypothetical protein n=1 Tax=Maritimibacter sp. 55A14 TaxID=2174844 RepID=UPI000D60C6A8|nr:hypothetical protein [Maritimibacter sp. 55A14]PWE32321.1 hypothetical protein DDZ14_11385 [Maritimibacter sp. 55A14]